MIRRLAQEALQEDARGETRGPRGGSGGCSSIGRLTFRKTPGTQIGCFAQIQRIPVSIGSHADYDRLV